MATELQMARAAHMLSVLYDRACALQFAPRNRWEADWQAFKARAKALRAVPETDAQRDAVVAVVMEALAYFYDEVKRHRALSFQDMRAVAREDRAHRVLAS